MTPTEMSRSVQRGNDLSCAWLVGGTLDKQLLDSAPPAADTYRVHLQTEHEFWFEVYEHDRGERYEHPQLGPLPVMRFARTSRPSS